MNDFLANFHIPYMKHLNKIPLWGYDTLTVSRFSSE